MSERTDREWADYVLSRTRIYTNPEDDDNRDQPRLTADEVAEVLDEGRARMGRLFSLMYSIVDGEMIRGIRCPVCLEADNPRCDIEC